MIGEFVKSIGEGIDVVGDFFTGGGGDAVATASTYGVPEAIQAGEDSGLIDIAGTMFSGASDFAGSAFGWIKDNPTSANLIGGVALGLGSAYSAAKDREMQRELQRERIAADQIRVSDDTGAYAYNGKIGNGLITNGMIAAPRVNG